MSKRKRKDLARSMYRGEISRREFFARMGKLGLSAGAAVTAYDLFANKAMAADFDWKKYSGETINLLLPKHPYADHLVKGLTAFTELTGIQVETDTLPEGPYFEKKSSELNSQSSSYDAFMDGIMFAWGELLAGQLADLNEFLDDSHLTSPTYDWEGMLPNMRASCSWSGVPGDKLGGAGSKQMLIPLGWEGNCVSYNREIFDKVGVKPPRNLAEMGEVSAKINRDAGGPYGLSVRGAANWGTIHPGYLSGFTSYDARDYEASGGKIRATMNSTQGKRFTKEWMDIVRESGPPKWTEYFWYNVGQDLGAGACGMIFDADILGFFQNGDPNNPARGKIAFAPFAANAAKNGIPDSNLWVWSLGMNNYSRKKEAAWLWMQYSTSPERLLDGAVRGNNVINPSRTSIWQDSEFISRLEADYPGYLEQYRALVDNCRLYFTAHPLFAQSADKWARKLHEIHAGSVPADEALDQLAEELDTDLDRAGYLLS